MSFLLFSSFFTAPSPFSQLIQVVDEYYQRTPRDGFYVLDSRIWADLGLFEPIKYIEMSVHPTPLLGRAAATWAILLPNGSWYEG